MIDKFTKIFKPQALQGGGGHYGPHEFSLVALKRQKILGLPNASMIINSSSLQLLWRKKIRRYYLQWGHGVPSKVEGSGVIAARRACTFKWEKHKNKVFHVLMSKYLQSLYFMLFILIKATPRCNITTT